MRILCAILAILCAAPLAVSAAGEESAVEPGAAAEPAAAKEEASAVVKVDAPAPAPAGEKAPVTMSSYSHEVGKKLKRGVVNVARAGTEFYVQPMEAKRVSGKSISMIWPGAGEACGMFLTRLFGGIIEGATCVVPFPNGWQPILDE